MEYGVIHRGKEVRARGGGSCQKRTPADEGMRMLKANVDVRKIFKNCQIKQNLLKKRLMNDDNLQITVYITE